VRAGQRAIGLSVPPPTKPAAEATGKKARRRKPTVRALKTAAATCCSSCAWVADAWKTAYTYPIAALPMDRMEFSITNHRQDPLFLSVAISPITARLCLECSHKETHR
jgi:hypothetical protein